MSERWLLNLTLDEPGDRKKLGFVVSALQHDAHVEHVDVIEGAGNRTIVEVTFVLGETAPRSTTLRALNHVFGEGGVNRMSKWERLLADDELGGVGSG